MGDEMKLACISKPDCVGFAFNPSEHAWYPKKAGTGSDPSSAFYDQKWEGQAWEWLYIKYRATVCSDVASKSLCTSRWGCLWTETSCQAAEHTSHGMFARARV